MASESKRLSISEGIGLAVNFLTLLSIIVGVYAFVSDEEQRRSAEIYQAWQVITAAYEQPGSGGRKEALEFLNSEPRRNPWFWSKWEKESLAGLAAPKAYLPDIQLPGVTLLQADLQGANLARATLSNAYMREAKLQKAFLKEANLQGTDLIGANLQNTKLTGAKLEKAKLSNAKLQQADLRKANLQGATYTDANTTPETCRALVYEHPCATVFPKDFDPKAAGMVLLKE